MLRDRAAFLPRHRGKIAANGTGSSAETAGKGRAAALSRSGQTRYELVSKPNQRSGGAHGSQDKVPGVVYRLGDAFQERLARRSGVSRTGELADYRGDPRACAGRHDRREPDLEPRRAQEGRGM